MAVLRRIPILVLACVLSLALSGCLGNSVTIAGQGGALSKTDTDSLDCGVQGSVAVGIQGGGSMTVKVTDGDGKEIFRKSFTGGGQDGQANTINGEPGTWRLTVQVNGGFGGQYSVTLSC